MIKGRSIITPSCTAILSLNTHKATNLKDDGLTTEVVATSEMDIITLPPFLKNDTSQSHFYSYLCSLNLNALWVSGALFNSLTFPKVTDTKPTRAV